MCLLVDFVLINASQTDKQKWKPNGRLDKQIWILQCGPVSSQNRLIFEPISGLRFVEFVHLLRFSSNLFSGLFFNLFFNLFFSPPSPRPSPFFLVILFYLDKILFKPFFMSLYNGAFIVVWCAVRLSTRAHAFQSYCPGFIVSATFRPILNSLWLFFKR